jgi:membrane protease subunit HflK
MAWNEPGKDSKKPDPWSGQPKKEGPPDLDELLRKLQQQFIKLFKKLGINLKGGAPSNLNGISGPHNNIALYSILCIILLLMWIIPGFFVVQPAEKAIVLCFGKYYETLDSGLHWIPPLIQSSSIVNVQEVATLPYQAEMLTQDKNIVSVSLSVQYRIADPKAYLFNVQNPIQSLQEATGSSLRQVIGNSQLDEILTSGQELVRDQAKQQLEDTLDKYQTGIQIMDVNLQSAKPPEEVTPAFDDAIKAREDAQRFSNQAMSYSNEQIALALGNAKQILTNANAYKQKVILNAQGATAQYLALLPEYQSSQQVTRARLYLDTMQNVYSTTTKILVEPSNGSVIYLPLDKLVNQSQNMTSSILNTPQSTLPITPVTTSSNNSQSDYYNDRNDRNSQPDRTSYPIQGDS